DDPPVPDLGPDRLDGLFEEAGHGPVRLDRRDAKEEVPKDARAVLGMGDLGMELDREQASRGVLRGGHRRDRGRCDRAETRGETPDPVTVAHPHALALGQPLEEERIARPYELGGTVLALA